MDAMDIMPRMLALRAAREDIVSTKARIDAAAKAEKARLDLDARLDLIDAEIIHLINGTGQPSAYFPNGDRITREVATRVEVTDWPAFMRYVSTQQNWQLVQQRAGAGEVVAVAQAMLDKMLDALPGDGSPAKITDYFKPENKRQLPPIPQLPGVRIVPRYTVKDVRNKRAAQTTTEGDAT